MQGNPDVLTEAPLYRQLAGQLRRQIESGELPEGELLPTEHELSARFQVSRQTVRAAIDLLRQRGLVESRRGVGTRVVQRSAALSQTFSATTVWDLLALVRSTELTVEQRSRFVLSETMAHRFGAEPGSAWLYLGCRRRDIATGSVLAWTDVYVDHRYAGLLRDEDHLRTPLFERIEAAAGLRTSRIQQEIRATVLSAPMAQKLDVAPGSPALELLRSYYFEGGRLYEVALNTLPASRFHYSVELTG